MNLDKLIIATQNPHKITMLTRIFNKHAYNITNLNPNNIALYKNYKETGKTLKEIAENKALYLSKANPKSYIVSTDGGMDIPALGNSWNKLYTRRFIKEKNVDDFQRMDTLLQMMGDKTNREMIWNEAIAIAKNDKIIFSIEVTGAKGTMQHSYTKNMYKPGIWLCSLWYFPQFKKNFFLLSEKEKRIAEQSWLKLKKNIDTFFKEINQ